MNRDEIEKLRQIHALKGLRLDTASGLSGTIYDADGSATAPVTALLDECERSFDKDAEITRLTARIAELEKALKPFVDEFKACRDSYIRRYPRHPAVGADNFDKMPDDWPMETSDFSMGVFRFARTTLEASERGGGE